MATQVDDLEVGLWVAITGMKIEPPVDDCGVSYVFKATGKPMRILAVSLPFLALQDIEGELATLDCRLYTLQTLNATYVRALRTSPAEHAEAERRRRRPKQ